MLNDAGQFNFDLKKSRFASVLWLDNAFPKKIRRGLAKFFDILIVLSILAIAALSVLKPGLIKGIDNLVLQKKITDFVFLILAFRLVIFSLESFYRSKSNLEFVPKESQNIADYLDFEAASLISKTVYRRKFISGPNILKTFTETEIGKFSFLHLGLDAKDFLDTLNKNFSDEAIKESPLPLFEDILKEARSKNKQEVGASDVIMAILEKDENLFQFFFEMKIKKEDIGGVLEWASELSQKKEKVSHWWLEENLARIQGIAKDWANAATYLLDRYATPFSQGADFSVEHKALHFTGHQKQIEAIEAILSRTAQANVLIVGEPGVGKRTVVAGFGEMIKRGRIRPELEFKRLLELDAGALVASAKTKGDLENLIIRLFNDAVRAGNIILVIDNFAEFLKSAEALGVSLTQVVSPYLASNYLQVIAISDSGGFKRYLESDSSLMQYFEIVRVEEPDSKELFEILEDVSLELEGTRGVIFLFQTIREIANASTTYLTEGACRSGLLIFWKP